jgi:hypothetical protein
VGRGGDDRLIQSLGLSVCGANSAALLVMKQRVIPKPYSPLAIKAL